MRVSSAIFPLIVTTSLWACSSAGDGSRPGGTSGTSSQTTTGGLNTTTGTGTGAGGTSGLIGGGNSDSGSDNCGHKEFNVMRRPAEVLLVFDRSGSMKEDANGKDPPVLPSKWSQIRPALTEMITATDADVSWGLKIFPEGTAAQCTPTTLTSKIDVEIAPMNATKVNAAINGADDEGNGTPTGDAIKQGVAYLKTVKTQNPKYILLATDGEPSCPGDGSQAVARPYAVDAVTAAATDGFHTFVVGVSTTKSAAQGALNDMAVAGLEPRDDPNPLGTKFYLGNTKDELVTALKVITGVVSDCTFPLGEAPPVPENIGVRVGTELAPKDAAHAEGWDYTGPDNMTVKVYGSWCDKIKTSAANMVQMVFACKGEIIN